MIASLVIDFSVHFALEPSANIARKAQLAYTEPHTSSNVRVDLLLHVPPKQRFVFIEQNAHQTVLYM